MNRAIDIKNPFMLYAAGMDSLVQELGAVGAVRFMQLFEKGSGDYTKEKYNCDDMSIDEIADIIYRQREAQ